MFGIKVRNLIRAGSIARQFCKIPETVNRVSPYRVHSVTITGRVLNIFKHNNYVLAYVKSNLPGNFRVTHKAVITRRIASLFQAANKHLEENHYVSIEGKLDTKQFYTDDGKEKHSVAINVAEMIISEDNENLAEDVNNVELLGKVITEVSVGTKHRSFSLGVVKGQKPDGTMDVCINRVFVYDEDLFPLVDDIKKNTFGILVRGELFYKRCITEDGRSQAGGYIRANQIYRIKF